MAYSKCVNPTIAALWRYPVKSMLGERCDELQVETRGAVGDRRYAVRDAEGKLGSGKYSRRFRRLEGLFNFQAAGDPSMLTFPDGRRLPATDPGVHAALSAALRVQVTLAEEKEVAHHDAEPLHLITTGSLARLGADERRFRPNLVIDSEADAAGWVGRILRIGGTTLKAMRRTERCVMITMAQSDLGEEPGLLRRLGGEAPLFGVYAEVLSPGRIRIGDGVVLL